MAGLLGNAGVQFDQNIWRNFLAAGTYSYVGNAISGEITHVSNGVAVTYLYEITNNGNNLVLTEPLIAGSPGVNSALDILNMILGTNVNSMVGIQYHYKKMPMDSFTGLFSRN